MDACQLSLPHNPADFEGPDPSSHLGLGVHYTTQNFWMQSLWKICNQRVYLFLHYLYSWKQHWWLYLLLYLSKADRFKTETANIIRANKPKVMLFIFMLDDFCEMKCEINLFLMSTG